MKSKMKSPGSALARTSRAEVETHMHMKFHRQSYATCGEMQSRHIRNRCGVSDNRARLIASLLFGEGA